jgi:hypothetical protein
MQRSEGSTSVDSEKVGAHRQISCAEAGTCAPRRSRLACAVVVLTPLLFGLPCFSVADPVERLSAKDIQDAIALGIEREPQPYLLRHASAGSTPNRVVLAAIYTPFLRVAFLSRAAYVAGRILTPDDLDAQITQPVVVVAFRWYCCEPYTDPEPRIVWAPIRQAIGPSLAEASAPLTVSAGVSALETFGATAPYDDIRFVARFPMSFLRTDHDFVIYRSDPQNHGMSQRYGHLLADDLATWR